MLQIPIISSDCDLEGSVTSRRHVESLIEAVCRHPIPSNVPISTDVDQDSYHTTLQLITLPLAVSEPAFVSPYLHCSAKRYYRKRFNNVKPLDQRYLFLCPGFVYTTYRIPSCLLASCHRPHYIRDIRLRNITQMVFGAAPRCVNCETAVYHAEKALGPAGKVSNTLPGL